MQVTVDTGEGLERRMTVQIPESEIQPEVSKRLQSMRRNVRLDGFRPGKVPMKVLERRYGRDVRGEVVSGVVQSSFMKAVQDENLRPAGAPTIDSLDAEQGEGVSYTAVFEVYPEVAVPDLGGVEVARPVAEVTDADVENMIETLRRQRRTWEAVERPAAEGDQVVVDYVGTIEGQDFPGNKGMDTPVELGSGSLIEGFESGLTGASAGEVRTLELTFPEDYHAKEVAGKPVSFEVTVKAVKAPVLPEVDAAFVQGFGVESGSREELAEEVRRNMERELHDKIRATLKKDVMDRMLEASAPQVPQSLVSQEAERLAQQTLQSLGAAGRGQSLDPGLFEDEARRRVALGLLLAEVARQNAITADPARVRERVETMASSYEQPEQVVAWYYADSDRLSEVESVVLEDQIVDWVLERARVEEYQTTFDAMMKAGQTQ